MPEVPPGPLQELIKELHTLHRLAGWPSVREMAKYQDFTYATVHDVFTRVHERAPRPDVVIHVVGFLAARVRRMDVEEAIDRFDAMWRAAAERPFDDEQVQPTST